MTEDDDNKNNNNKMMMMMIMIIIIIIIITMIIIMEASEKESGSRQGLNWDVVLGEEEATCVPSGTCGQPPVTRHCHYNNSQLWWTSVWPSSSQGQISAALLITDPHSPVSCECLSGKSKSVCAHAHTHAHTHTCTHCHDGHDTRF